MLRRKRFGAASTAHRKMIDVLYPRRKDSQVTPLGTYRTNLGRRVQIADRVGENFIVTALNETTGQVTTGRDAPR